MRDKNLAAVFGGGAVKIWYNERNVFWMMARGGTKDCWGRGGCKIGCYRRLWVGIGGCIDVTFGQYVLMLLDLGTTMLCEEMQCLCFMG